MTYFHKPTGRQVVLSPAPRPDTFLPTSVSMTKAVARHRWAPRGSTLIRFGRCESAAQNFVRDLALAAPTPNLVALMPSGAMRREAGVDRGSLFPSLPLDHQRAC